MKPYPEAAKLVIMAHRGGRGEAVEHSQKAYERAVALGFTYLELDVHLDETGALYLRHDKWRPWAPDEHVTLEWLLTTFPDNYFAIDPKEAAAVQPLADMIVQHGIQRRVCIGDSTDAHASAVAKLVDEQSGSRPFTALVSFRATFNAQFRPSELMHQKEDLQASFIHVHHRLVTRRLIRHAHASGLKVIAWTVNNPNEMRRLVRWDIDGFMTDYPDRARLTVGVE